MDEAIQQVELYLDAAIVILERDDKRNKYYKYQDSSDGMLLIVEIAKMIQIEARESLPETR